MRIHHLNCGTLRPLGGRLINGQGLPLVPSRLVCHCLLLETADALALVDTGFGLADTGQRELPAGPPAAGETAAVRRKRRRYRRFATRARLDPDETAARQLERLGHARADVAHIVLTHLDSDHSGGLPDFPRARVHVSETEHRSAMSPPTPQERFRYWSEDWAHRPDWVTYPTAHGDRWLEFEGVREIDGLEGVALVPLAGHTRGHCGVAIRTGAGWLLHAADAYFFHGEVEREPRSTPGLARFQTRVEIDHAARIHNRERLRALRAAHGTAVEMVCSHDPADFDRYDDTPT